MTPNSEEPRSTGENLSSQTLPGLPVDSLGRRGRDREEPQSRACGNAAKKTTTCDIRKEAHLGSYPKSLRYFARQSFTVSRKQINATSHGFCRAARKGTHPDRKVHALPGIVALNGDVIVPGDTGHPLTVLGLADQEAAAGVVRGRRPLLVKTNCPEGDNWSISGRSSWRKWISRVCSGSSPLGPRK